MSEPVLECVTKEETVCHTSYVTQYVPIKVSKEFVSFQLTKSDDLPSYPFP